jgi:hypothetical protein
MPYEKKINETQSEAIALLKNRLSGLETATGRLHGLSYRPRSNDIGISTTPKAGTTWMQQICHQIRCAHHPDVSMNFEEISAVVPWIELAFDQGQDLEAEQTFEKEGMPRLFKTHSWYNHCPRFPKTIVVFRDPFDVLLSFYHFFEDWFFEPGTIDLDTFANEFWLARGVPDDSKMQNASYFVHLVSWYEHRHEKDSVLIVFFEDLKENLPGQIRRIAKFMSNNQHRFDTESVIKHVVDHSSFEFMKSHAWYFDEKISKRTRNEACGLPKDAGMSKSKLMKGHSGLGKDALSPEIQAKIRQNWRDVVEPITNCSTYEELRNQFATFYN